MTGEVMRIRGLLLCVAMLACGMSSASATMRIAEDRGGQIGQYLQTFAAVRSSGERVVIDGNCLSACTLVLGLIPHDHICATPRARFGFHAAWMPDNNGRPVTSPMGTQALWNIYPPSVRHWISRHGGLSRRMIFMEGRSLNGIVRELRSPAANARASALRAPLLVASGARHTRKRRQRPPLAPSPRRRGCRSRRKANPTVRSPPPTPRRARSRGNLARSRPARRGAWRATKPSAPRWVAPNEAACSNCSHGSTRAGGSSAMHRPAQGAAGRADHDAAPTAERTAAAGRKSRTARSRRSRRAPTAPRSPCRLVRRRAIAAPRSRNRRRGSTGSGSPPPARQ